ncbi:MAG: sensor histidine kinase [Betaproteobacteria bacterium]
MATTTNSPLSLRQRLLAWIVLPLALVLGVSVFFDFQLARETANTAFDRSLADAALDIAAHIRANGNRVQIEISPEAEAMLRTDAIDTIYFAARDEAGNLLAGDGDLPRLEIEPGPYPTFSDGAFRGRQVRFATLRIPVDRGDIFIAVAETTRNRNQTSRRMMTAMILPNLLLGIATLVVIYFGVRRGLLPLDKVEQEIAQRSPRDLHPLEVDAVPREIRPTLRRLNELFELLRAASAAQRRFLADAAHQLRTPLAGLQTQTDLLAAENSKLANPERLERINEGAGRINHLVSQLLAYARAEPAAIATQNFQPVALHQIVEASASIFLDQALVKKIDLGFDIAPATVDGIAWMLTEALSNLIDNAIHYTPEGGSITVRSGMHLGKAFMAVEDSGPGIAPDERPRVLERFYRIAGSEGNGCGLGLSIVQEIAAIHGAEIVMGDAVGGGLLITLTFPG